MFDSPGLAPAARSSEAAKPIMMAVRAMFDITVEIMAEITIKPRMTRLILPFTMRTTMAMRRCGNVDTPRNVVKPKIPTNIHSELVNVAAQISL